MPRHPGTESLLAWLTSNPRLPEDARRIAGWCQALSEQVTEAVPDCPELTAGLRKLLEAKDCFVRAALASPAPLNVSVVEEPGGVRLDVPAETRKRLTAFGWLPPMDGE